jgi:hypothetical protein
MVMVCSVSIMTSEPETPELGLEQRARLAGGVAAGEVAVGHAAGVGHAALHHRAVVGPRRGVAGEVEAGDRLAVPAHRAAVRVDQEAGPGDAAAGHAAQLDGVERSLAQRPEVGVRLLEGVAAHHHAPGARAAAELGVLAGLGVADEGHDRGGEALRIDADLFGQLGEGVGL